MDIIQTWLPIIKDIVTILATGIAAYVGFTGLQTWQRQLRGNAEYDLARRVLLAVYKVRDAINNCRFHASLEEVEADRDGIAKAIKQMHDEAIAELEKAKASLEVELVEAEAVWGGDGMYMIHLQWFGILIDQIRFAYQGYYSNEADEKQKADAHSVLFREDKDKFSEDLKGAIKRIEDVLRPKLTMKQARRKKMGWWRTFKIRRK